MSWRFAKSLLVLLATINICGRAQNIFATLMNVVNLRFVSDVRQEVVREISISRYQLELLTHFAPEPPVTARADPRPFYPL